MYYRHEDEAHNEFKVRGTVAYMDHLLIRAVVVARRNMSVDLQSSLISQMALYRNGIFAPNLITILWDMLYSVQVFMQDPCTMLKSSSRSS